jgi:hypothetical protein
MLITSYKLIYYEFYALISTRLYEERDGVGVGGQNTPYW